MTSTQLKHTPLNDSQEALIFGICDRLYDNGHCITDVVLVPANENGEPDFDRADPANIEALPADQWPEDERAANRAAVIVSNIAGCHEDSTFLVTIKEDGDPVILHIHGPETDRDIAHAIIGRDIGAAPVVRPPSKLAKSMAKLREELFPPKPAPAAANDNNKPTAAAEKPSAFIDAQTLLSLHFEPIKYVVPGFVAEGLTLLGGRPKLGKSWLALDFGIAVATGGKSLGAQCQKGDALILALEDNQRRLQDRLKTVLPRTGRPDMSRLSLLTEAPKINAGLIDALEAWRTRVSDPRLIIIDTLAMVRAEKKRNQDSYSADYEALSPLQRYASQHRLAIVVVTHVRKAEAEDPLEMISGTNGLTGAADSIMILNRTADGPKLYGRGRDVEEVEKALKFDGGRWSVLGDVEDVKRSGERTQIIEALRNAEGPMKPSEIAEATGMKAPNVSYLLRKMVAAGEAVKDGYGTYSSPPSSPSTPSSSSESIPPSSAEVDFEGEHLKDFEDLKGGTPSSDGNQGRAA